MNRRVMRRSGWLIGLGILLVLIAIGLLWSKGGKSWLLSVSDPAVPSSGSQIDGLSVGTDVSPPARESRETNVESRVRSLLEVAPGEMVKIRIPPSGFEKLLPADWEKNWADMPMVPISREAAVHGLEEILRQGGSLGSRVDIAHGKIEWNGDGISVKGEVEELGDKVRRLCVVAADGRGTGGSSYESMTRIHGHSFFLVRVPGSDADGVLLVLGEDPETGK